MLIRTVSDEEIAEYRPLCETIARPLVGLANAEADDLEQEGLLHVWLRLRAGDVPAAKFIRYRMQNYCRFLAKQNRGEGASYSDVVEDPNDWVGV